MPSDRQKRFLRLHLGLAIPLTAVAVVLNYLSVKRVQLLLPDYPERLVMGLYTPLPIVHFFHAIGTPGLLVALVVFTGLTMAASRSRLASLGKLAGVGGFTHILLLSLAVLSYGWCIFRIGRVLG